jgi:hypothetical protein
MPVYYGVSPSRQSFVLLRLRACRAVAGPCHPSSPCVFASLMRHTHHYHLVFASGISASGRDPRSVCSSRQTTGLCRNTPRLYHCGMDHRSAVAVSPHRCRLQSPDCIPPLRPLGIRGLGGHAILARPSPPRPARRFPSAVSTRCRSAGHAHAAAAEPPNPAIARPPRFTARLLPALPASHSRAAWRMVHVARRLRYMAYHMPCNLYIHVQTSSWKRCLACYTLQQQEAK